MLPQQRPCHGPEGTGGVRSPQPAQQEEVALSLADLDQEVSTRLGEVGTNSLCITAAKVRPGPADRRAGNGILVEDTLSRVALGPTGGAQEGWGSCPATSQGRKGSEKKEVSYC